MFICSSLWCVCMCMCVRMCVHVCVYAICIFIYVRYCLELQPRHLFLSSNFSSRPLNETDRHLVVKDSCAHEALYYTFDYVIAHYTRLPNKTGSNSRQYVICKTSIGVNNRSLETCRKEIQKGFVSILPEYPLDKIIILKQTPQDIVHRNTCLLYLMTFPGRYMANSM